MKKLCIYHSNCADGFGAAWVVRKKYGDNVEFHAGVYQNPPPDVTGRDVILVDFSYKLPVMKEIIAKAASVLVIDHHKTAIEDLAPLQYEVESSFGIYKAFFDTNHSGAMLAWLFYFDGQEPPALLKHIEDRDLWKFNIDGTRQIQAAVFSHPYDFKVWDQLMDADTSDLLADGVAIERKHFKDIEEFIGVAKDRMTIAGYSVPSLNCPYMWASDAGNIMAKGEPFAVCYYYTPQGIIYSLRSAEDGIDVSEIAKKFGGGGHKHAAGFKSKDGTDVHAA